MAAADNSLIQRPGLTTAEAPQQKLSKGDIAAPYADLAHGMSAIGEGVTDVATNLADQAGRKAVRTDDAGNVIVDKAPLLIGPASQAYARAARMTALAKLEPQMQDGLTDLRLKNPNNPEGFKAAAKSYLQEKVGQYANDPVLAGAVEKAGAEAASHNYRTSLIETNHNQVAESLQAYQARIKDINEQTSSLARQGGTDTPEYISASANRAALWSELQKDPRFKFSKERADLEVQEAYSKDVVQSVVGNVQRTFQDKRNLPAAQRALQDAFWGPGSDKLRLTAAQRDHGITEGLHALANLSAQDREAVADNKRATSIYVTQLMHDPALWNEGEHGNLVHRAEEIGDYHSLADLQTAKSFVPLWDSLKRMPPDEAAYTLGQMSRGIIPAAANFMRGPLPGAGAMTTVDTAAGKITVHKDAAGDIKGFVDDLVAAGAPALPVGSYNERRIAGTEKWSQHAYGTAVDYAQSSRNVVDPKFQEWADANPDKLREIEQRHHMISGGDWHNPDFGHFEWAGPGGTMMPGSRIDLSADNATARLFQSTIKDFRTRVAGVAEKMATGIEDKVKRNDLLAPDELQSFVTAAVQSGKTELIDKVQPSLKALDILQGLPEGASATAVEAQIKALQAAGVDRVDHQALEIAGQAYQQSAKDLREKPLIEGAKKQWFAPIGSLDPQNPQSFVGELQDREKKAGLVNQHDPGHGPVNLIAADEGNRVATALTQGDPQAASQILGAIGTLSPENSKATMFAEPIKKAVVGMSGSSDPARMTAAMTAMDTLWRRDPAAFKTAYGGTAADRLAAWQVLKDQFSPQEVAERINRAEDPLQAEARRKIGEEAEKELKSGILHEMGSPQAVANQLGSWADRWVPFVNAAVSIDATQAGAMAAEFSNTYKQLKMYSLDPSAAKDQALKRLAETWQYSDVAGGRFIQNAPERAVNPQSGKQFYPPVDGSQRWMTTQLMADLEQHLGPQVTVMNEGADNPIGIGNWRLVGLIPDSQTQGEISSGKPPRYQVAIQRNGQIDLVPGPNGRPLRYQWDYEAARAAALPAMQRRDFNARQRVINAETLPPGPM